MKSSYVFGATMALTGVMSLAHNAEAATAASFTFETSAFSLNTLNVTAPAIGPLLAESGSGSAFGFHADSSTSITVYSSPAGNGSARAFSSNVWATGDYYQFSVPTTGLSGLIASFDAISSATGPKIFNFQYSTDGVNYVNFSSYTVNLNASASTFAASSATAPNPAVNFSFNLTAITALNNNGLASFRLSDADTTGATGGTSRVDNFVVATAAVPEPASLALVTVAAGGIAAYRRRRA